MFEVTAVANGYYGSKIRVPLERFGITDVEHFSVEWMDTTDKKVLAWVREQAKDTGKPERGMTDKERTREVAKTERARRHKDWLENHSENADDDGVEVRRVNTGGTDGVVGAEIPKPGQKLSAKERIKMAEEASGRTGLTAKEADEILAALSASGGSDNDDRSRDQSIDQSQNAPAPSPEPAPASDAGNDI